MSSSVNDLNPTTGTATTASVRTNFTACKDELNQFHRMSEDLVTVTGTADALVATFTNAPASLYEGLRVTIVAASNNATTTPTLNVNALGAQTIVQEDGTALQAGNIVAGGYYDLVYDATATNWVLLNQTYIPQDVSSFAPLASPALTGTPTAPTPSGSTGIANKGYVDSISGVKQILQTVVTGTDSVTGGTWTDVTGFSVAITPTSASSVVVVDVSCHAGGNVNNVKTAFRIVRGATEIGSADAAGSRTVGSMHASSANTNLISHTSAKYIDSPSTTSATTYKVQWYTESGFTGYLNRSGTDTNAASTNRVVSSITVTEFLA